jgi:hypothetical protein
MSSLRFAATIITAHVSKDFYSNVTNKGTYTNQNKTEKT